MPVTSLPEMALKIDCQAKLNTISSLSDTILFDSCLRLHMHSAKSFLALHLTKPPLYYLPSNNDILSFLMSSLIKYKLVTYELAISEE